MKGDYMKATHNDVIFLSLLGSLYNSELRSALGGGAPG